MVVPSVPTRADPPAATLHDPTGRWLLLDGTSETARLADALVAAGAPLDLVAMTVFADALRLRRPRIVLVPEPPATLSDLRLVAEERRRRQGLRAVHLAPPDAVDERIAALRLGFDDALPWTIEPVELAGRLRILLARASGGPAGGRGIIAIGEGLELDLVAHELRRDGTPIHLRPKEHRLLALLAAHPGRAYTRRQLLDRVWGSDRQGDPRTVDVHIRWLRSKLEPDPANPIHLVTVRGVGYRLDPIER